MLYYTGMEEDDIQAIRDATIVVTVDVSEEEEVNMLLFLEFDCLHVIHIVYPRVLTSPHGRLIEQTVD